MMLEDVATSTDLTLAVRLMPWIETALPGITVIATMWAWFTGIQRRRRVWDL